MRAAPPGRLWGAKSASAGLAIDNHGRWPVCYAIVAGGQWFGARTDHLVTRALRVRCASVSTSRG